VRKERGKNPLPPQWAGYPLGLAAGVRAGCGEAAAIIRNPYYRLPEVFARALPGTNFR
jgi:hypothetical protein